MEGILDTDIDPAVAVGVADPAVEAEVDYHTETDKISVEAAAEVSRSTKVVVFDTMDTRRTLVVTEVADMIVVPDAEHKAAGSECTHMAVVVVEVEVEVGAEVMRMMSKAAASNKLWMRTM